MEEEKQFDSPSLGRKYELGQWMPIRKDDENEEVFLVPLVKEMNFKPIKMGEVYQIALLTGIPINVVTSLVIGKSKVPEIVAELFCEAVKDLGITNPNPDDFDESKFDIKKERWLPESEVYSNRDLGRTKMSQVPRMPLDEIKIGDFVKIKYTGWAQITKIDRHEDGSARLWAHEHLLCDAHGDEELTILVAPKKGHDYYRSVVGKERDMRSDSEVIGDIGNGYLNRFMDEYNGLDVYESIMKDIEEDRELRNDE